MIAPLDLLAFGAHPDDIEIGLAGCVARHAAAGHRVGLCDLTAGELGSNGTPAQRRDEAEAAARVLGGAHSSVACSAEHCCGLTHVTTGRLGAARRTLRKTAEFLDGVRGEGGAEVPIVRPARAPFRAWLASGVRRPFTQSRAKTWLSAGSTSAAALVSCTMRLSLSSWR